MSANEYLQYEKVIEQLKTSSQKHFNDKKWSRAQTDLTKALQYVPPDPSYHHLSAELYVLRGFTYLKRKDCSSAEKDAKRAFVYDQNWYKTHLLSLEWATMTNAPDLVKWKCARLVIRRVKRFLGVDDLEQYPEVLEPIIRLLYQLSNKDTFELIDTEELHVVKLRRDTWQLGSQLRFHVWRRCVELFAGKNDWNHVAYLFLGGVDSANVGQSGLATGCSLEGSKIDLKSLLLQGDSVWMSFGEKLTILLIQHGADPSTMVCELGGTQFHAAISMALQTGLLLLIQFLQTGDPDYFSRATDKKGNSVLHQVCIFIGQRGARRQTSYTKKVIQFLSNKNIDSRLRNNKDKLAIDYLSQTCEEYMEILKLSKESNGNHQVNDPVPAKVNRSINPCDECKIKWLSVSTEGSKITNFYPVVFSLIFTEHGGKHKEHTKLLEIVIKKFYETFQNQAYDVPEKLFQLPVLLCGLLQNLCENGSFNRIYSLLAAYKPPELCLELGPVPVIVLRKLHGDVLYGRFVAIAKSKKFGELVPLKDFTEHGYCRLDQRRQELYKLLVKFGSTGNDLIRTAINADNFQDILWLIDRPGEELTNIVIPNVAGEVNAFTPFHYIVQKYLNKGQVYIDLIIKLIDKCKSQPENSPWCLQRQNQDGDSLLHLTAKLCNKPCNIEVAEKFYEAGVDPFLLNKSQKHASEYLKKIKGAGKLYRLLVRVEKQVNDRVIESRMTSSSSSNEEVVVVEKKKENPPVVSKAELVETLYQRPVFKFFEDHKDIDVPASILKSNERMEEMSGKFEIQHPSTGVEILDKSKLDIAVDKISFTDSYRLDPHCLDSLEWEIECSSEFWKCLYDWSNRPEWCAKVLNICSQLAKGDWKDCALANDEDALVLHKVHLSDEIVLLWERAVAFSPRQSCFDCNDVRHVYSDIIRIWYVVHVDELDVCVDHVMRAHERGRSCRVTHYLTPNLMSGEVVQGKHIPRLFELSKVDSSMKLVQPGSVKKTEYHIMKFYSMNSDMLVKLLSITKDKIDYPFRVTDREAGIINLKSETPSPLILIGRSGTGKTTCCLYRLVSEFLHNNQLQTHGGNQPLLLADEATHYDYRQFSQLYITKNAVLCSEVQKSFTEIFNGNPISQQRSYIKEMVTSLEDISPDRFPLFLTDRLLLLLLDESLPGDKFFDDIEKQRFRDPNNLFDELNEDWLGDDEEDIIEDTMISEPSREITFDRFLDEVWPAMGKKPKDYHPSLVWMEILSFIKGSQESLKLHKELSREEYISVGRKRAPNFQANREEIYNLFLKYKEYLTREYLYDICDVVHNLDSRLPENPEDMPVHLDQIYIDETQDFTQAELQLIIRLCQKPYNTFFTGDTAQSIMRGVAFRFTDLKTLFHESTDEMKRRIQPTVMVLPHNYRSHAGILQLANSVVDILGRFFPESFDRLDRDQGLFEGPKPVLIESSSAEDLNLLLLRTQRQMSSRIEFGAHQAIIVPNEEARDALPAELEMALVLTIYEAKGLEFDDVLIYNFFTHSQNKNDWRVVTTYLQELSEQSHHSSGHYTIDEDIVKNSDSRPLLFDPNAHKMLNSELKYLYTAITRARVNVWMFDEDPQSRQAIFDFFQALGLVKTLNTSDVTIENLGSEGDKFASKSTDIEWRRRGVTFFQRRQFGLAAKCYRHAGLPELEEFAKALEKRAVALNELKTASGRGQASQIACGAALDLLGCDLWKEAGQILISAKEYRPAAIVYERMGLWEKATKLYLKAKDYMVRLCIADSQLSNPLNLIASSYPTLQQASLLCQRNNQLDRSIDCMEQGQLYLSALDLAVTIPGGESRLRRVALKGASLYHSQGNKIASVTCLRHLSDKDQIIFLIRYDLVEEAIKLLDKTNANSKEACELLFEVGKWEDARTRAYRGDHKNMLAECEIADAEVSDNGAAFTTVPSSEVVVEHSELIFGWNKAKEACIDAKLTHQTDYCEFRSTLLKNTKLDLLECFKTFNKHRLRIGAALCFHRFMTFYYKEASSIPVGERYNMVMPLLDWTEGVSSFTTLLEALQTNASNPEHRRIEMECYQFLGVIDSRTQKKKQVRNSGYPLFLTLSKKSKTHESIDLKTKVIRLLQEYAEECIPRFYNELRRWSLNLLPCEIILSTGTCDSKDCEGFSHTIFRDPKIFLDVSQIVGCLVGVSDAILTHIKAVRIQKLPKPRYSPPQWDWTKDLRLFIRLVFPSSGFYVVGLHNFRDIMKFMGCWSLRCMSLFSLSRALWSKEITSTESRMDVEVEVYLAAEVLHALFRSDVCQPGNKDIFLELIKESEDRNCYDMIYQLDINMRCSPLRLLLWGREIIYFESDPVLGAEFFVFFLTKYANLKPSIPLFMRIWEHTLALFLCYFSRATQTVTFIPESYYNQIIFYDKSHTFSTRAKFGRYRSMIDNADKYDFNKRIDRIKNNLCHLAHLICHLARTNTTSSSGKLPALYADQVMLGVLSLMLHGTIGGPLPSDVCYMLRQTAETAGYLVGQRLSQDDKSVIDKINKLYDTIHSGDCLFSCRWTHGLKFPKTTFVQSDNNLQTKNYAPYLGRELTSCIPTLEDITTKVRKRYDAVFAVPADLPSSVAADTAPAKEELDPLLGEFKVSLQGCTVCDIQFDLEDDDATNQEDHVNSREHKQKMEHFKLFCKEWRKFKTLLHDPMLALATNIEELEACNFLSNVVSEAKVIQQDKTEVDRIHKEVEEALDEIRVNFDWDHVGRFTPKIDQAVKLLKPIEDQCKKLLKRLEAETRAEELEDNDEDDYVPAARMQRRNRRKRNRVNRS